MTTRNRIILLLCIGLVASLLLACDWGLDDEARRLQWQSEVNSRQRGLERPTATVVAERTGR